MTVTRDEWDSVVERFVAYLRKQPSPVQDVILLHVESKLGGVPVHGEAREGERRHEKGRE